MEDRCICCGDIIPEGRQVCPSCEADAENTLRKTKHKEEVAPKIRRKKRRIVL